MTTVPFLNLFFREKNITMGKTLIAKGQVSITTLADAYSISQSVGDYIFSTDSDGRIISDVTVVSIVKVTQGDANITNFTIGVISKPAGFSNIIVDNSQKTITYTINANTTTLAKHGSIVIPILISGLTYNLSFRWAKAQGGPAGDNGKDGYTIKSSRQGYTIATDENGRIHTTISISTVISALRGTTVVTPVIGKLPTVDGCTLSKSGPTVTFTFNSGTSLADQGIIDLPVTVDGISFSIPFSYAKARAGASGAPGTDMNLLDWVNDWNTNKTQINNTTVVTPKIFAGVKNSDGTLTGIALGRFILGVKNTAGSVTNETVDGIYGFKEGYKTFFVDNGGNAQLGRGEQFIKYNASTGQVEFGSGVSLHWIGATYIDKKGIFTGKLSADTIKTVELDASQITSGMITASRIDVASLKSTLITAGNMEALTLNVIKGKIGGWIIDGDSLFRGTKNNSTDSFTSSSGAVTLGSNGLRGYKWRLDSTGAGALADGNILWDTAGNVTFGASVTVQWTSPINSITTALGGTSYPKLTKITAAGIYTGSITASQITAGTISADRIATGSINASKLDAASIKSGIINVDYINGLTCTFTKGKIGDWTITPSQIFKNNIYLGSDGSITNGTKWKLNNDGSGQIANGNISWNAVGAVTFSSAVSLNWKNDIEAAKTANFGYRYYKKIIINGESAQYYPVIFKGGDQTVKRDILIRRAYNEQAPSDWDSNSATHKGGLILLIKVNFGGWGGAAYSWDVYELSESYSRMFAGAVYCGNSCMFAVFLRGGGDTGALYHLYSDQPIESSSYSPSPIPSAPQIAYHSDLIFQSGESKAYAPAPRTLTSSVEEEIRRHRFIALAQDSDMALTQHPLTYIGPTGIYTGTLTATQVNAVNINASSVQSGNLSADRIAAGSLHASKLNAASIKSDIINTTYINGLTCTFIRGKIGGFAIGSDTMSVGSIGGVGATPLQIRSASIGNGYWYTGGYKPLGVTLTWHQNSNAGHIVLGQIAASGNSAKTGFIGLQMMAWDNTEYFCLSANYTKSGGKEVYNRIAGWAFDNSRIWKNNVSLGSDGTIYNGEKWRFNNDGSGKIANGNISWNTSGTVTFASSVSLNWTTGITAAQELASAMAFGKMLYRDPTFYNGNNGINVYNNSNNGTVTITRRQDGTAPNDSKYVLVIRNTGASSPNCGGFYFGTVTSYRKIFITRIIARIPSGRSISYHSNAIGNGGSQKWLTSTAGTGDWKEYICKVNCGTSNFSSTHFFALTGTVGSSNSPVEWTVAYATVFDVTSAEKYTTTIDGNGIYTGTVRANQVIIDSTLVVGGSSYNGSISVRDAGNTVQVKLDRSGIWAIGGKVGGFTLNDHALYSINATAGHTIGIQNNGYMYNCNSSTNADYWAMNTDGSAMFGSGKIKFNADGSGYIANQNIKWDTSGNVTMNGIITAIGGKIAGFTISGNKLINTASDSSIEFSSMIGNASLHINTSSALINMRADSSRTGISIQTYATGARGIYIIANAGSKYAIESYGPMQLGQRSGERWCVPGVLYIGCKYSTGYNNYYRKIWGDGVTISSFSHIGDGKYRVYHNLRHTDYTVMVILWSSTAYYGFFRLLERTSTYFVIQNIGSSGKADAGAFDFIIMGRNAW